MNLLLDARGFAARVKVAAGPLCRLADSLAADLEPLLARDIYFPREKAVLSRTGGRCPHDGELLAFDPHSPHEHRCPRCGRIARGELHDRFWIYWYQLWLAERAVHAAVLGEVRADARLTRLASEILHGYTERYLGYPNVDNVLGPTRLFFSTYLESIWLLQVCVAADILSARNRALVDAVRDRIVEPSRALIAQYDEGGSNRQVWNDVALLAAARLLGDASASERAVHGPSGITRHLRNGLLADGSWYEGENYHLFAHRGLWYGVTMAEHAGIELRAADVDRFQLGFSTPFLTALPDLTFPSRRDSQYAVSLRQWRVAEHCELGLARRDEPALTAALSRLYANDIPRTDTGRSRSSADVERNAPPSALSRADLSWRALLCARSELLPVAGTRAQSALLEGQGIAVFRRNGARTYVALDYGHSGGGHGHPDRLNVLLADGNTRWLDDYGTGSYVERSLHWYRSTLAHNAPLADGHSQRPTSGVLVAYDERDEIGWARATAQIAPNISVTRTLVVTPSYMVDTLAWTAPRDITLDLPLHADLEIVNGAAPAMVQELTGGDGLEDGFDFVTDATVEFASPNSTVFAVAQQEETRLQTWMESSSDVEWWRGVAPGPPRRGDRPFRVVRARGRQGRHRLVWDWTGAVRDASFGDRILITLADGAIHEHTDGDRSWRIDVRTERGAESVELRGARSTSLFSEQAGAASRAGERRPLVLQLGGAPLDVELGQAHYRRSEVDWTDAGRPSAVVSLNQTREGLSIRVRIAESDRTFSPADATNPYDNESPDVNGDGVQLYLRHGEDLSGWMLVPEPDSRTVRIRQLDGWSAPRHINAHWSPAATGYELDVVLPGAPPDALDLIVNEKPVGRERRRGQLVLSGARDAFVYLRGDRHDRDDLVPVRVIDG